MQFHVPQFIDVEDKVFGPLSAKQFAWVGGAIGTFIFMYTITESIFLSLIIASPIMALGVALAFYKINNRPFIYIVEAAFKYITNSRLYVWKKTDKKPVAGGSKEADGGIEDVFVPKLSDSKLKDLAWSLDIQESDTIYSNNNQR